MIHITHGIRPQAIGQGARVLAGAIPYLPVGVHLAVVDPGRRLASGGRSRCGAATAACSSAPTTAC